MENQFVVLEGKNYDKIVKAGMQQLKTNKDNISVEVLESKKNLFSTHYKIKISIKNYDSSLSKIEKNLDQLFDENDDLDLDADFKIKQTDIEYREDGVYITINEITSLDDIKEKISIRRVKDVNLDELKQCVLDKNFDNAIKIAEPQLQEKVDSKCELRLSKDLMEAYVYIFPPFNKGEEITKQAVITFLKEHNIVHGINQQAIDEAVQNKIYGKDILIATGEPSIHGIDAIIEYHFDVSNEKKIKIDKEGRIDFRDLSLIKNVLKGDKLVTLIPSTEGTTGKNVMGSDISTKAGKPLSLPKGKNVEISEDGLYLIASIDGEVKLLDGKVSVFALYEVPSNVDNSTGNIKFLGKVSVKGNVLTGFEIEAEGDVEVFGVVEGAKIVSKGNIILHRGIQGMNKGELYCEGDLIAKFMENCTVDIKGNIHSDAIMHSRVICGKKLEATGNKGLLVGGWFKVGDEIKAKVLGSPMATVTELEVGINPDLRTKYEKLKVEQKQTESNLQKTGQAVDLLTKISQKTDLPQAKKILLAKSVQLKTQLHKKMEQINSDIGDLENYFEDASRGKIKASHIVYPGCRIMIGSSMMYVKDSLKFVTFYRGDAEIKIGPFEE